MEQQHQEFIQQSKLRRIMKVLWFMCQMLLGQFLWHLVCCQKMVLRNTLMTCRRTTKEFGFSMPIKNKPPSSVLKMPELIKKSLTGVNRKSLSLSSLGAGFSRIMIWPILLSALIGHRSFRPGTWLENTRRF